MSRAWFSGWLCGMIGAVLGLVLHACGPSVFPTLPTLPVMGPPAPPAHVQAESPELAVVQSAADRVNRYKGLLAEAQGQLDTAQAEARELRLAGLRRLLWWLDAVCLLGVIACVGLFALAVGFGLPFGRKVPLVFAGAFAAMFVLSLVSDQVLDHLWWVGAGALVVGGLVVAWALWHYRRMHAISDEALRFGTQAIHALDVTGSTVVADAIKEGAKARQRARGVWKHVDQLAAKHRGARAELAMSVPPDEHG